MHQDRHQSPFRKVGQTNSKLFGNTVDSAADRFFSTYCSAVLETTSAIMITSLQMRNVRREVKMTAYNDLTLPFAPHWHNHMASPAILIKALKLPKHCCFQTQ